MHQYDPNRPHFAISTHQPHPTPKRHQTYPTVLEASEEDSAIDGRPRAISSPDSPQTRYSIAPDQSMASYPDPYSRQLPTPPGGEEPRRARGLAALFTNHLGPSPKSSPGLRNNGPDYLRKHVEDEDPEERARLFGGRQSEDLYRSPPGREADSSPETSPVRYTSGQRY